MSTDRGWVEISLISMLMAYLLIYKIGAGLILEWTRWSTGVERTSRRVVILRHNTGTDGRSEWIVSNCDKCFL